MWVREWFKMGDAVACYMLNQNDPEEKTDDAREGGEHSLALPFFGIGMKTDLFQSCGHC